MNVRWNIKLWFWWDTHKGWFISIGGFIFFILLVLLIILLLKFEPRGESISDIGVIDQAFYNQTDEGSKLRGWNLNLNSDKTIYISDKRWWNIKKGDCVKIKYTESKWTKTIIVQSFKKSQKCK